MKFYCLTSVELESNNFTDDQKIFEFKNYCLTLIEIGPNKHHLNVLNFQRENAEKISLLMKPKSIIIKSIDWIKNDIVDLGISSDANRPNNYAVKAIRISNIKVTKNTSLSEDEKRKYTELTRKLNHIFSDNSKVIKLITTTKFYASKKSSQNRLRDIQKLILTFCDSEAQNFGKEIPESAKYLPTTALKGEENVRIGRDNYHQRKRDNKLNWGTLSFDYVSMPQFDDVWFDAINLKELELSNIKFSNTSPEAWKSFANGIKKLRFLNKLVISGNFDEIPYSVFEKLPISLETLILYNLKNIPDQIGRLKNLKELSLIGNSQLIAIPWEYLPENITELELVGTGIAEIPNGICRLVKLNTFRYTDTYAKSVRIPWTSINKNIKFINVSQVENLTDLKYCNFAMLQELKVTESSSEDFEIATLPKTLKTISIVNNGIDINNNSFDFPYLNELYLSDNDLTEFPFHCITKPMAVIDLSENHLKELIFCRTFSKIQHLNLSKNEISTIKIDHCITWNNDDGIEMSDDEEGNNFGMILNLSENNLHFLPAGFEKLPIKDLSICKNYFSVNKDIDELDESFWNRLPKNLRKLDISKNTLFKLPCLLQNLSFLNELTAENCELDYICPWMLGKLFGDKKFSLNIKNNSSLAGLPFAPTKIFPHIQNLIKPIKCEREWKHNTEFPDVFDDTLIETWTNYCNDEDSEKNDDSHESGKILTNSPFLNIHHHRTIDLIFKPKNKLLNKHLICKCCARCGNEADERMVEQLMTMDYELFQEEIKKEEEICNYWKAKTWKTTVVTKFCAVCIDQYKEEAKELNLSSKRKGNVESEIIDDEMPKAIYAEPQPCSSRTKPKKVQRLQPSNSQPLNLTLPNNSHSTSAELMPMEEDSNTQFIPQQSYSNAVQHTGNIFPSGPVPQSNNVYWNPHNMTMQDQNQQQIGPQQYMTAQQNSGQCLQSVERRSTICPGPNNLQSTNAGVLYHNQNSDQFTSFQHPTTNLQTSQPIYAYFDYPQQQCPQAIPHSNHQNNIQQPQTNVPESSRVYGNTQNNEFLQYPQYYNAATQQYDAPCTMHHSTIPQSQTINNNLQPSSNQVLESRMTSAEQDNFQGISSYQGQHSHENSQILIRYEYEETSSNNNQ